MAKSITILVSSNWKILHLTSRSSKGKFAEWLLCLLCWNLLESVGLLLSLRFNFTWALRRLLLFFNEGRFMLLILRGILLFLWFLNWIDVFCFGLDFNSIFIDIDFFAKILLFFHRAAKNNLESILINFINVGENWLYQISTCLLILNFLIEINC